MAAKHEHGPDDKALERELDALKKEYERLREERVRNEQNLENLTRQLAELEARAQAEYGTSDPEALEKLLAERRAENARLVEEYKRHVQDIQAGLAALEKAAEGQA